MKKLILPILLCAVLLGGGAVLAHQSGRIQALESAMEEKYLSALNETTEEMQSLSIDMEKALVSADPAQLVLLVHNISRSAGDIQRRLADLPLSHAAMAPTLSFANQLSDYASSLLPVLATEGALPADDLAQLEDRLALCSQLSGQLMLARRSMAEQNLTLLSESSVFSADNASSLRPLETLGDKDHGMNYPTLIYDGPFSDGRHDGAPRGLPQGEVTEAEAQSIARDFVGADQVVSLTAAPGASGQIPAYGVTVQTADVQLNLEVTRQGGKILWMMPETASFQESQSVQACRDAAAAFLSSRGFGEMEATHHQVYDGLCVVNFAAVQDGVLLYPDLVKVQVRMDTAQIVGLEAHNYWVNHVPRSLPKPVLTLEEAREHLSAAVEVASSRLCVIPDASAEILCYEFTVRHGEYSYLIYIDAQTGREVQLLKIIPLDGGLLTA